MKLICIFLFFFVCAALSNDFSGRSKQLSISLYNELSNNSTNNFLVGPIFIETLLALSESGAAGTTATEIRKIFNFPDTNKVLEEEVKEVLSDLQSVSAMQNLIYYNGIYPLKATFAETAKSVYQATIHENTKAVVDMASYFVFRSDWKPHFVSFPISNFYINANTSIEVEGILQASTSYNYAESEDLDAKFLELPFETEGVSMILILPRQKEGLEKLEKNIENVFSVPQFEKQFVYVTLPKFKIAATLELSSFLKNLGLEIAFGNNADFSGIAGDPGDIYLGEVTQKAAIEIDYAGVNVPIITDVEDKKEATKLTGIRPPKETYPFLGPPATRNFTADHPFMFYIQANGVVIVEGKVVRPDRNF